MMQISEDLGTGCTVRDRRRRYSPLSPDKTSCQPMWPCCASTPWRVVVASLVLVTIGSLAMFSFLGPHHWRIWTNPSSWKEVHRPGEGSAVNLPITILTVRVYPPYRKESPELYPWVHVAEPYRMAVMEVNTSRPSEALSNRVDFRWDVGGVLVGNGESVEAMFKSPGRYECSVSAFLITPPEAAAVDQAAVQANEGKSTSKLVVAPHEMIVSQHSFVVTVKYVRREIRSLTDRDRETFFNAVSVLQHVPSAVGQQVYGRNYYSKDYFNRMHLYYGGRKDCDHWHDGPGFVTSHIAISLMFEQALQAVDPSIALPYWDFTIEGTEYDWTNFRQSSVFSDDWFGSAAPRNDFRTMHRGRFAYVPTMTDAREFSDVYNAYGLLRSPWNTDPNPFLTRHDHIFGYPNNRKPAGCKQYRDAILKKSWMDLTQSMNAGAHGHIHELLGGTWSAGWHGFEEKTTKRIFPFIHSIVPNAKYLWRSGHLECPESCAVNLPWRDCQCKCADLESISKSPPQVLEEAGLLSKTVGLFFYDKDMNLIDRLGNKQDRAFTAIPGYSEEETAEIYSELLSVLCTPMKIGSHYEGTSTNDVTFWVLHPTFDRLWHLRRLQDDPNFEEVWYNDSQCYGHNPKDVQPFHNLFDHLEHDVPVDAISKAAATGGVGVQKRYRTNMELYDLLQPDGLKIPYMYDNFEWIHCEERGIYINAVSPK